MTNEKPGPVGKTEPSHESAATGPMTAGEHVRLPAGQRSPDSAIADFVAKMKTVVPVAGAGRGRLAFAMDATMSRAPAWDLAISQQSKMFDAVKSVGGLDVQLVYFRGASECRASKWVSDPAALAHLMSSVSCHGGLTQIGKVLSHVRNESTKRKINALVYVGDCMEENIDQLCARAGELALMGTPVFVFQEGYDAGAELAFREIARLTNGAWCRFDAGSAEQLRQLLTAVAVYAAGGHKALLALGRCGNSSGARLLLEQMQPRPQGQS